jgi:phosphoglycerate dehydrogenase-like enzyme
MSRSSRSSSSEERLNTRGDGGGSSRGSELRVHITDPPEEVSLLRRALDQNVRLTIGPDLPAPADFEVLVSGVPAREEIEASPRLRALIIPWSGLSKKTRDLMLTFPNVAVHNLHHNAAAVAELAVGLLLAAGKFIVPMDRALRADDWTPRYGPSPAVLFEGKTALILGYGAVGRRVARICRGMGMKILATRRGGDTTDGEDGVDIRRPHELHELLPSADAILVCLPLTPATESLLGRRELELLPPGAVLVNVGRGAIVDERALHDALKSGSLHAAGLDVWYHYPKDEPGRAHTPPSEFPFRELPNVVMSPHRAGAAREREVEVVRMEELARLLNAAARDSEMPNSVDVERGY